ncbi:MAG: hypothetical protein IBJ17_22585 [Reyranella sp.]|jgi:hypothetical protein|nr:hypothetical protein [Reyranella sp.]
MGNRLTNTTVAQHEVRSSDTLDSTCFSGDRPAPLRVRQSNRTWIFPSSRPKSRAARRSGETLLRQARGCPRVYWQTQAGNATARLLYDKVAVHRGFIRYDIDLG